MSDLAKAIRVRAAIEDILQRLDSNTDANGLIDAYTRFSVEARSAVAGDEQEEFDRLFPAREFRRINSPYPGMGIATGEARAALASLSGWLRGMVEAEQMRAQIDANAAALAADRDRR